MNENQKQVELDNLLFKAIELHKAIDVVDIIEAGANPLAINSRGKTTLYAAYLTGDINTFLVLLDYGADLTEHLEKNIRFKFDSGAKTP